MNRRLFLKSLVIGAAGVVLAPETVLDPVKKTYFLPPDGGWGMATLTPRMQAALVASCKGLFANAEKIHQAYLADWRRDAEFVRGDQWPADVRAERLAAGRPTLTINHIPSLASQGAHAVAKTDTDRAFVYERIASDRGLHDLQRLYNYQLSSCAELMALAPSPTVFVSGRQVAVLQPAEIPLQSQIRETCRAMEGRAREIVNHMARFVD